MASAFLVGLVAAPVASAADSSPCGADQLVTWWTGAVQPCPMTSPLPPNDWIPVYTTRVAHASGAPVPDPAGWLHSANDHSFVCQQPDTSAVYYHPEGFRNVWWAFTQSDDGAYGWVPEVFFRGGLDDEPDSGLRRCPTDASPGPAPAPGVATAEDSDGDGAPNTDDACPNENARPRDANLNGCLDYLRLEPEVKLTPGVYVKLVGNRYRKLGVTVRRLTVRRLPTGAQIELRCSQGACPTQHATAKSKRRLEFPRMRGRKLRTGVRVSLITTLAGFVGAGTTYTVLPNDTRKREFCIPPGSTRKGSCATTR